MDGSGLADVVENFDHGSSSIGQFLPPVPASGDGEPVEAMPEGQVDRLREDLRRLAAEVAAIDRRDAAQHGGLKGEIAHLVRRIARLEAVPRARQAR